MKGRFIGSVIAYFVATMLTAYPWHMLLFHAEYVAMGAFTKAMFVTYATIFQCIQFVVVGAAIGLVNGRISGTEKPASS